MTNESKRFQVALSFAGEDRDYVEGVVEGLNRRAIRVFYDRNEEVPSWGKNLPTHLQDIYQNRAQYVIPFLSNAYASKVWTRVEMESAQARAIMEPREYILPVRLDDTRVPGFLDTIVFLDGRKYTSDEIAERIAEKVGGVLPEEGSAPKLRPNDEILRVDFDGPVVVWRLPRGFLALDDLVDTGSDAWSTIAHYFTYPGSMIYGTHYHSSYYDAWWNDEDGYQRECRNLQIERGDWIYAFEALRFMTSIRHGVIEVSEREITREGRPYPVEEGIVEFYEDGRVPPQKLPEAYHALHRSGNLRDLQDELADARLALDPWSREEIEQDVSSVYRRATQLRRQTRIRLYDVFSGGHAIRVNADEVLSAFPKKKSKEALKSWLSNLEEVLGEAIVEIHGSSKPSH